MRKKCLLVVLLSLILCLEGCSSPNDTTTASDSAVVLDSIGNEEKNSLTSEASSHATAIAESDISSDEEVSCTEEAMGEMVVPTTFTEDEEWLHSFIELNFEDANKFVQLEYMGSNGDVEVCIAGDEQIGIYGRINGDGPFANAEKYRESLSEYYSADIVDRFMDNVTICKKVKETDESYYHAEGVDGRIYVEIVDGQKYDENGEPVICLTKYIEIDGVMYKDTGEGTRGTDGVFEYSKIVSMTDDEIIFTYPLRQSYTDEFILVAVAEGRLVKEDGNWKFGWYIGEDNITNEYNDMR